MPLDEFLNCLNCAEENTIWWSFRMNDLVGKSEGGKQIWTKKEYAIFIGIMSRPETERMVYLRLANSEEDNEDKKEDNEDEGLLAWLYAVSFSCPSWPYRKARNSGWK